jgi:hypothetical protein
MNWFIDIEALLSAISQAVPAIEKLFPHAAGGIAADAAIIAKTQLVASVVAVAVPSLTVGQTDEAVQQMQKNLPALIGAVQVVQAAVAQTQQPAVTQPAA